MAAAKQTYTVTKKCNNCGYDGEHKIPFGTPVAQATCKNCGCKMLGQLNISNNTIGGIGKVQPPVTWTTVC